MLLPLWWPNCRRGTRFGGPISLGVELGHTRWALVTVLVTLVLLPVLGMVMGKLGPRRSIFFGLVSLGLGVVLGYLVRDAWQLYVVFVFVGLGSALSGWLPVMTTLNNWFDRRKTMAMAAALLGSVPLVGLVTVLWGLATGFFEFTRYSWHDGPTALLGVGMAYLALAFPLSRLVRDRPEDMGLLPDGEASLPRPKAKNRAVRPSLLWLRRGARGGRQSSRNPFGLIAIGFGTATASLTTIPIYWDSFLEQQGYPADWLAQWSVYLAFSLWLGCLLLFVFVGGYLGDKFPLRKSAFAFSVVLALSVVFLVLVPGAAKYYGFQALSGIATGGLAAIPMSMIGRYFGRKAFAAIICMSLMPTAFIAGVFWVMVGLVINQAESFDAAFLALAAITLVGGLAFLMMGEPPRQRHHFLTGDGPLEQAAPEQLIL